jgi:hypothetical protein
MNFWLGFKIVIISKNARQNLQVDARLSGSFFIDIYIFKSIYSVKLT